MIVVDNLAFRRGQAAILQGVHATIEPGRLTAIIGPNGSGKSTLLRLLAGELQPERGRVLWEGQPLRRLDRRETARRFAVLPQSSALTFDFAVEEVVLMGRTPHRRDSNPERDQAIATAALERVGMEAFAHRLYNTLSGGEKQRAHLARVLAQIWEPHPEKPRYLFLDEPTSSLDLKHQHSVLRIARELSGAGAGVLVVLHDLTLARRYADSVLILKDGRSAGFGPPGQVLSAPRLEWVFEVSHDLIPGALTPEEAGPATHQPETETHHDLIVY
jgi:iron complex transport system ATP-binding protein